MPERPIIVFDVNEAPLGLQAIRPVFDRIFSDPAATCLWFPGLITYSEALRLADVYVPFTGNGSAVLQMPAAARGITISDADGAELTGRFRHDAAPSRGPRGAGSATMACGCSRSPTTRWRSPAGSWRRRV